MSKRRKIVITIMWAIGLICAIIGWNLDKNGATATSTSLIIFGGATFLMITIDFIKTLLKGIGNKIQNWLDKK